MNRYINKEKDRSDSRRYRLLRQGGGEEKTHVVASQDSQYFSVAVELHKETLFHVLYPAQALASSKQA